ncbi:unnamed protein product [Hyaloperonospora brassicae]|uniref:RxLR effector candidate protein n=1 Tax=Hyaloperonospora brassicae TaxID=162125 RepID=A0AAV0TKJ8_HYABA|nr:unnamed protein product [Hyaloperonospora brassicae]
MDAHERQCLVAKDSDDEDGPRGLRTAFVTTTVRSPTRRGSCPRAYASLRSDVWTLLHYRTSLKERSGLHRASYPLGNRRTGTDHTECCAGHVRVGVSARPCDDVVRLDDRYTHPVCGRPGRMSRPMSIIDLVVLIPFYLRFCSSIREQCRRVVS